MSWQSQNLDHHPSMAEVQPFENASSEAHAQWHWVTKTQASLVIASVAAILAVIVQFFIPTRGGWTVDGIAGFLFDCLETDVVTFAIPAAYFRWTVPAVKDESFWTRLPLTIVVGMVSFGNLRLHQDGRVDNFAILCGTVVASYVPFACAGHAKRVKYFATIGCVTVAVLTVRQSWYLEMGRVALGCGVAAFSDFLRSIVFARLLGISNSSPWNNASRRFAIAFGSFVLGGTLLAPWIAELCMLLLPLREMVEAYELVGSFVGRQSLHSMVSVLLIETIFCQVALGYLGIAFLIRSQERKNNLISIEDRKMTAAGYCRFIVFYMAFAAFPYMLQRTIVENINGYAYGHFCRRLERSLRIASLFPEGQAGLGGTLLAAVHGSKHTVEAYTDAFNSIVGVAYGTVERKLFSVPKLMLLPGMLIKQPWLVVTVLPASVLLDIGRSRLIAALTKNIERFSREIQELAQRRRKIEQHDTKNEELIRRGVLSNFAEDQWRHLALEIEKRTLRYQALTSFRAFINTLYRADFLQPCYELVLAFLLEMRHIAANDIWVYLRVIEDTIDFSLTRPRMDAQLASMRTNMDRVYDLSRRLERTRARERATCSVDPGTGAIYVKGLQYTRGPVEMSIPELTLRSGRIYAVTGANGCGKSSFFGILASCGRQATMLPEGLEIRGVGSLILPSFDVLEITQHLYCSLFTKPITWMLQRRDVDKMLPADLQKSEQRIQKLSAELAFHSIEDSGRHTAVDSNGTSGGLTLEELHAEVDDWYGMLSGGQRGKAEFIKQVFMKETCPGVVIIDEAFAPLDPTSKMLVQRKLKEFCSESVVLVIYHSDASEECVHAGAFFDENLHFQNGTVLMKQTCPESGQHQSP